jgi:hypothetical protein
LNEPATCISSHEHASAIAPLKVRKLRDELRTGSTCAPIARAASIFNSPLLNLKTANGDLAIV